MTRRSARRPYLLLTVLALGAGCSSNGDDSAGEGAVPVVEGTAAEVPNDTGPVIADLSDPVLSDGNVTRAEIESLYLAYFSCLSDAGVKGRVAWDLDLSTALNSDLYLPGDDESGTRLNEITERCTGSIDAAASAYASEYEISAEVDQQLKSRFLGCLNGIDEGLAAAFDDTLPYYVLLDQVITSPQVASLSPTDAQEFQRCTEVNFGTWRELP